jgi:hypothetical protein
MAGFVGIRNFMQAGLFVQRITLEGSIPGLSVLRGRGGASVEEGNA